MPPVPDPRPDRPALERLAAHIRSLPTRPRSNRPGSGNPGWTPLDPNTAYFDWANWTGDDHTEHSCGTFGCVAGHAVALFPDLLMVNRHGSVDVIGAPQADPLTPFGLTNDESRVITIGYAFYDGTTNKTLIGSVGSLSEATSSEAADRILAVLALAEARFERLSLDTAAPPSVPSAP